MDSKNEENSIAILEQQNVNLFAVSRIKNTHGLDVDHTTLTMGSLSTVPAQVIRGLRGEV